MQNISTRTEKILHRPRMTLLFRMYPLVTINGLYAVYTDLKTSADHLAKLTIRSFFRNTKQIQNYMNFLALDMQLATKFVGVYMQVLDYLGDNQSVQLISARYQYVLKDFFTKGIGKKNISADEILQMNYPYTESNRFC